MWKCDYCDRAIADHKQGVLVHDRASGWIVVHRLTCDPRSARSGEWLALDLFTGKNGARALLNLRRTLFRGVTNREMDEIEARVVRPNYNPALVQRTTFVEWLRQFEGEASPLGDLAYDVARDAFFTLPDPSFGSLYSRIRMQGDHGVLAVFVEAYREWQSYGNTYGKPKKNARAVSLATRFRVLKRDTYRCQICGRDAQDGVKLEIDHRIPVSKGGSSDQGNLWTLCFDCNRGKQANDL